MKYLFILFGICSVFIPSIIFGATSTIQDSYIDTQTDYWNITTSTFYGQTFTPSSSYDLGAVDLYNKLSSGTCLTGVVYIYNTSGGVFTGSPICTSSSGDISGVGGAYNFFSYYFSTTCNLTASTKYGIKLLTSTNADCSISFGAHNPGGSYSGGDSISNVNEVISGADFIFRIWNKEEASTTPAAIGQLTFPWVLITILAAFILCFIIDKGGARIIGVVEGMYRYKF